jgi:NADH-quinone oxidoreductase subunit N
MPLSLPDVELAGIGPEVALTVTAFVVLLVDALVGDRPNRWYLLVLSTVGLGVAIALALDARHVNELQLSRMVAVDGFATFVKVTLACFGLLTVWLGRDYLIRAALEEAEFYGLVLFAVAGMMLMAAAADLIVMFVALETFSIALYVLVGFRRASLTSQESAMK